MASEEQTTGSGGYFSEDIWAIILGAAVLLIGIAVFFTQTPDKYYRKVKEAKSTMAAEKKESPFRTVEWYQAREKKKRWHAKKTETGAFIQHFLHKPYSWDLNPVHAFYMSDDHTAREGSHKREKYQEARQKEKKLLKKARSLHFAALTEQYRNDSLNKEAAKAASEWYEACQTRQEVESKVIKSGYNIVTALIGLMIVFALFFGIGRMMMGYSLGSFVKGFFFIFLLGVLSYMLAHQQNVQDMGIGYAFWAILIGLLISNTIGTPSFAKPAIQTEYYIKTGLVLLGAEILFGKILSIGVPGLFVAWIVTPIVLLSTFWFGQKILKLSSKTLNITISADMSVCGVSAAIATAAACRAKKEELTLAVGMSLLFTSIMMVALPAFIRFMDMPDVLGGAWIGGTIDATGAVAAAGAFLGERALNVAATIKMIQNILIGVIAFGVALYWTAKVEQGSERTVGAGEIWRRFPKFILGFIGASILFSSLYSAYGEALGSAVIDHGIIEAYSNPMRDWFFCFAFVSIGLATDFRELKTYLKGGKPLILYLCGQTLNILLTLLMAYIMFYKVFPAITASI